MKLKFTPCRADKTLTAFVSGDKITLNGVELDFGMLPEGALLPASAIDNPWVSSSVERVDGVIQLSLLIPHGPDAPDETRFPSNFDTFLTAGDGPVPIPAYEVSHD